MTSLKVVRKILGWRDLEDPMLRDPVPNGGTSSDERSQLLLSEYSKVAIAVWFTRALSGRSYIALIMPHVNVECRRKDFWNVEVDGHSDSIYWVKMRYSSMFHMKLP